MLEVGSGGCIGRCLGGRGEVLEVNWSELRSLRRGHVWVSWVTQHTLSGQDLWSSSGASPAESRSGACAAGSMTWGNGAVCSLGATSSSEYFSAITAREEAIYTYRGYTRKSETCTIEQEREGEREFMLSQKLTGGRRNLTFPTNCQILHSCRVRTVRWRSFITTELRVFPLGADR